MNATTTNLNETFNPLFAKMQERFCANGTIAERMAIEAGIMKKQNKKSGVRLSHISPSNAVQGTLFDTIDRTKHKALMQAMDHINSRIGHESVKLVSQGAITNHTNREHLSPQYTTRWEDILVIKV